MAEFTREQIKNIVREELGTLIKSDRFTFQRLIQLLDGVNIQISSGTGTKIGTATGQKIAFHGVTPVIQASAISAPSGGTTVDVEARTAINSIRTALTNKGITG